MDVSVIISTWNNAGQLRLTLEALCACATPADATWELVLVNNACTDDTNAVVEPFRRRLPLVYVDEPRSGVSHGRNAGLAASSGKLIVFTDDDVRVKPDWIACYWRAYLSRPAGFYFGGPIDSEFETAPPPRAPWLVLAPPSIRGLDWGSSERALSSREFFVGGNWACPIDALTATDGFDSKLGLNPSSDVVRVGEESELMNRLTESGWKGWYLPESRVTHFVPARKSRQAHVMDRRIAQLRQAALARLGPSPGAMRRARMRASATAAWLKWILFHALGGRGLWFEVQWRGYASALEIAAAESQNASPLDRKLRVED